MTIDLALKQQELFLQNTMLFFQAFNYFEWVFFLRKVHVDFWEEYLMHERVDVVFRFLKLNYVLFNIGEIMEKADKSQPTQGVIFENSLWSLQQVK